MTGALTLAAETTVLRVDRVVPGDRRDGRGRRHAVGASLGARGVFIPVVVVELVLGVLIGPQVARPGHVNGFTEFFADLGLGDVLLLRRLRDRHRADPGGRCGSLARLGDLARDRLHDRRGARGGGIVVVAGLRGLGARDDRDRHPDPRSSRDTGRAAARALAPICSAPARSASSGRSCCSRWSSRRRARCTTRDPDRFVALAVVVAVLAVRSAPHAAAVRADDRDELAARGALDRRARLRARAARLRAGPRPAARRLRRGADHPAGPQEREIPTFDSKLTGVAFGVFIPFFFVVSGMQLDIDALFASLVGRR